MPTPFPFDGPMTAPLRESDRFRGSVEVFQAPARMASGNLPDQPTNLPSVPLGPDGPLPWRNLSTGR